LSAAGETAARPRRSWRRRLAAVALGAVLALGAGEILLRLAGVGFPSFYGVDPDCGVWHRPFASGFYSDEGGSEVEINADGLRDILRPHEKPAGTVRIAVLGDSYAEAFQVPRDRAFPAILERELGVAAPDSSSPVEVLNFGVAGFGTAQELLAFRHHALAFAPDIVLLAVTTGNDIADNSRVLNKLETIPYFTLEGDRLVLDDAFRGSRHYRFRESAAGRALYSVMDHCRIAQALNRWANLREQARVVRSQEDSSDRMGDEAGLSGGVYREPSTPEWKDAWRVTEALIEQIAREVRASGAPDPSERRRHAEHLGVPDLDYPDRRIRALCDRAGIPFFALAPILRSHAESNRVFVHGFGTNLGGGHWNELGHEIAGRSIGDWIRQSGFISNRTPGGPR
jgi:hypothetical protein